MNIDVLYLAFVFFWQPRQTIFFFFFFEIQLHRPDAFFVLNVAIIFVFFLADKIIRLLSRSFQEKETVRSLCRR